MMALKEMFINDVPLLSESLWSCLQLASLIFYELEEMFIAAS